MKLTSEQINLNKEQLTTKTDDSILIKEYINKNSERAAYCIVEKYRKKVYLQICHYINDYDEAEDITQEVFIKALKNLDKFQQKCTLSTWLYTITKNTCFSKIKEKKEGKYKHNLDTINDFSSHNARPDEELEFNELNNILKKAFNQLPKKQTEIFLLRFFYGMKYEEISKITKTSIGTLKANYFNAINKIKLQIKKTYNK